jgi:arginine repressor
MIINFEEHTHELNGYEERTLLPLLIKGLKTKVGKDKAVTNKQICKALTESGYKINDTRIRKMIQYIRVNDLVPLLIATSKGYYLATEEEQVEKYIRSLSERLSAISKTRDALIRQLKIS